MERRALLAVVISILILVVYQEVVLKRLYAPSAVPPESSEPPTAAPAAPEAAPPPAAAPALAPPEAAAAPAVEGNDVVVDTDLYEAVFATAGARLKSLVLKRFRTTVAADSPPLQMIQYPVDNRLPLGVALVGASQRSDAGVVYRVDQPQHVDIPPAGSAVLTFTGELDGATVRKRIEMHGDVY